jgi:uncharacterized membrane protein
MGSNVTPNPALGHVNIEAPRAKGVSVDLVMLLLRLLHIGLGVFWAGTAIFVATFLFPSIAEAGPDGAKVVAALTRRRFMQVLPAAAGLTILSGLYLYWRVSGGFQPSFMHSGMGMTLGLGAAAAIAAFVVGVAVMRPAMMRAGALAQSAAQAAPADRQAQLAEAQALRQRGVRAGQVVAVLVTLTVAAMALARYM